MKADKMFEKLGYEVSKTKFATHYDKDRKRISVYDRIKSYWSSENIGLEEHKALVIKLKENGWLDE